MAKMDQRQKGILVLTVLALLFLAWQVYNLIKDDLTTQPTVTKAAPAPTSAQSQKQNKSSAPVSLPQSARQPKPVETIPQTRELPRELMSSLSFPARPEYLRLANQYEMAKMQRQLLEEEVAIANAKAQIAKLDAHITEHVTSVPESNDNLPNTGLQLVFVAQNDGHWTATLNQNGVYQSVVVGSKLPPDIKVVSIDNEGVVVDEESTRKKLTFNGMITLAEPVTSEHDVVKAAEQKSTRVS